MRDVKNSVVDCPSGDGDTIAEEDSELMRIRQQKLQKLMNESHHDASVKPQEVMPDKPVTITDATIAEIVQKNPLVVIDCWAPWCGPCRFIAPVIEALAKDYAGKIVFGKLDVDHNPLTARKFSIMSIPTILIFKNGKLVDAPIGAMPRQALEPMITKYLKH